MVLHAGYFFFAAFVAFDHRALSHFCSFAEMATEAFMMSDVTVFSECPTRQCSSIEYLYTATPGLAGHHGQIIGTLVHGEPSVLLSAGLCEYLSSPTNLQAPL